MLNDLDAWYISQEEPVRSCLLALRSHILSHHPDLTETWTHRMPMFRLKGKLFAYLWIDKENGEPYMGIYRGLEVEHDLLILGKRKKMKVIHFDARKSLPIATINEILDKAAALYL